MSEAGQELVHLVWGKKAGPRGLADTIFCRWAQGSNFEKQGRVKLRQFMPSIRSLKNVKQIPDIISVV